MTVAGCQSATSSPKAADKPSGGRLSAKDLEAVAELFEIFYRWDEEARAGSARTDVDTSEPVNPNRHTK
jgi:hypothetical protein